MKAFIYTVMLDKEINACVLANTSDSAKLAVNQQFKDAEYIHYRTSCEVILQNQEQVVVNEATPPREQNI
jgi:hypothetical protein